MVVVPSDVRVASRVLNALQEAVHEAGRPALLLELEGFHIMEIEVTVGQFDECGILVVDDLEYDLVHVSGGGESVHVLAPVVFVTTEHDPLPSYHVILPVCHGIGTRTEHAAVEILVEPIAEKTYPVRVFPLLPATVHEALYRHRIEQPVRVVEMPWEDIETA